MNAAIFTALSGMMANMVRLRNSALNVANAQTPESNVDLAREAVEQIAAEHSWKANIATIRTAQEMERSLLDIKV